MNFGNRIAAISSVLLLASFGTLVGITSKDLGDDLRQRQASALTSVSQTLRSTLDRSGNTALAMAQMLALQPGNIAAVASGDRASLLERLTAVFEYLNKQDGVELLQFQAADLKAFLRLHDPTRFGDDISQTRPMVVAVNRQHKGQNGLEMGSTGLSLRAVAPMMDGTTLVGTAEVGLGLPELISALKTRTGAEVAVLLSTAMTGAAPVGKKLYGDLMVSEATDNALLARLLETSPPRLAREDTFSEITVDGSTYGIAVTPLLDFSGRMIGGFMAVQDFTAWHAAYRRTVWEMLFIAFGCLVVCYSVLAVAMRAFVVRPLAGLGDWLEGLSQGHPAAENVPPAGIRESDRIVRAATALAGEAPK